MKTKQTFIYYILLVLGALILLNVISDKFFFRLDFTEDKRYTLNDATRDILETLQEPVTITAYFSEDLPPNVAKTRRDFKELLVEYASISRGMIVFEFIDPKDDEEIERKAVQAGIQPVMINSREKDQSVQKKAFLGALVQLGEETDAIPFMQPGFAMEYALSSSIKKLSVLEKPLVGLLQGHGEPSIRSYQQVMASLNVLYQVEPVTISDTIDNLAKYTTVAIVAPKDSFSVSELIQLDNFLSKGKNLFIALNRVDGDLNTAMGSVVNTGLETWLGNKGITVESNFVIDANCGSVMLQQQQGTFRYSSNVNFPYIPVLSTFEEHSITKGLEAVMMPFVSSITYSGDSSVVFTPIVKSSEKSGTQPVPTYFDIQKRWTQNDFPLSGLPVAAVFEGKLSGVADSRLVLIADGDFPVNGEGQQARQIQPDNANLMVNSIDWLSDDTGLISLRTRGITSRPLDQVEDGKKFFLKWLNFLLPILLIVIYGIIRMQQKRNLRIKRMEVGYV